MGTEAWYSVPSNGGYLIFQRKVVRKMAGGGLVKVQGYSFLISLIGEGVFLMNQCVRIV